MRALVLSGLLVLLAGCTRVENAPPPKAGPAPAATAEAPKAPTCPPCNCPGGSSSEGRMAGVAELEPATEHARQAIALAEALFAKEYSAVHAMFGTRLQGILSAEQLGDIVNGVTSIHGAPERITDAFDTSVEDFGTELPAVSVLVKMSQSPVRFRLQVVFRGGVIDGLWFKPA